MLLCIPYLLTAREQRDAEAAAAAAEQDRIAAEAQAAAYCFLSLLGLLNLS